MKKAQTTRKTRILFRSTVYLRFASSFDSNSQFQTSEAEKSRRSKFCLRLVKSLVMSSCLRKGLLKLATNDFFFQQIQSEKKGTSHPRFERFGRRVSKPKAINAKDTKTPLEDDSCLSSLIPGSPNFIPLS